MGRESDGVRTYKNEGTIVGERSQEMFVLSLLLCSKILSRNVDKSLVARKFICRIFCLLDRCCIVAD